MNDVRFIDYIPTPFTKFEGVAYVGVTVESLGEIMLGFKVIQRKDGSGIFFGEPTWKLETNQGDEWKPWTMIDSNIAKERLFTLIRQNINKKSVNNQETQSTQPVQQNVNTQQEVQNQAANDDLPF